MDRSIIAFLPHLWRHLLSGNAAEINEGEEPLYRQMKLSQGGVMLLVRLNADLQSQPREVLERICDIESVPDPQTVLPETERLRVTFGWLEKQFGRKNAARAVAETAHELLDRVS